MRTVGIGGAVRVARMLRGVTQTARRPAPVEPVEPVEPESGRSDAAAPERRAALCHAPFASLHLDPAGHVRVCELNSLGMLGTITQARLPDLWRGEGAIRLRAALRADDLSLGCEACVATLATGDRHLAHAGYYDQFPVPDDDLPAWPRQLELSLSNVCNLQCVMCDGDLSSAIRSKREGLPPLPKVYDDQFFDDLREFLPHLERVTFIGGEPFLGPESLRVFDMLAELDDPIPCWVTTNGTVYNARVERILRAMPVDVSVSIDGATAATYEAIREGSSFDKVMRNVERFREHAARVSLNFCLMTANWSEFHDFLAAATAADLDVHVNIVTGPKRLSLYHLSAPELAAVVERLGDRSTADVSALGRNQRVWDEQLHRLRGHLTQITGEAAVALRPRSGTAEPRDERPVPLVAAEWGDPRGVAILRVGRSEIVLAAEPDPADILGMDLRHLVGGHLVGMVAAMTGTFGQMTSSTVEVRSDGIEDRRMSFDRDGVRTEIRGWLTDAPSDAPAGVITQWYLAARSTRPEEGPG